MNSDSAFHIHRHRHCHSLSIRQAEVWVHYSVCFCVFMHVENFCLMHFLFFSPAVNAHKHFHFTFSQLTANTLHIWLHSFTSHFYLDFSNKLKCIKSSKNPHGSCWWGKLLDFHTFVSISRSKVKQSHEFHLKSEIKRAWKFLNDALMQHARFKSQKVELGFTCFAHSFLAFEYKLLHIIHPPHTHTHTQQIIQIAFWPAAN